MAARIYKPAKTAMQQGKAQTRDWVLGVHPDEPSMIEPLMGWTSSDRDPAASPHELRQQGGGGRPTPRATASPSASKSRRSRR